MNMRVVVMALAGSVGALAGMDSTASTSSDQRVQAAAINTQLGLTYMRQGDLQTAREKIEKALTQNPRTAQTQMAAGFLYDRLGDDKKAQSHFDQAVRLEQHDPDVLNNAAVYYCRKGDKKVGVKYFLQAAQSPLYRTPEVAYTNAGRCARADGRAEDAELYFRKALDYKAQQPDALLQLAELYQETSRSAQALPFLQRHLAVAPVTAPALWLGYRIETSLGDTTEAREYADRMKLEFAASNETRNLLEAERGGQ